MSKNIVLIGASGHGKVLADIAKLNGYERICFLDDNPSAKECDGYPVVGSSKNVEDHRESDFIVSIGNASVRQRIQTELEAKGLRVVSLIHPNATVAASATIGAGTAVMAGAVINAGTRIGRGCIINTCSSVDHDCEIMDFAHVSVGAHVAGTVRVGERTWLGIGSAVNNNVEIPKDCMIGAGAVVIRTIEKSGVYVGIPAAQIK